MKIVKEKFKTDRDSKIYWGRVYFISDNRGAKTKLLWAMSFEFVRRQLLAEKWNEAEVERLVNIAVVNKIKETKRQVFNFPVKFLARGIDQKDESKLILHLQEQDRKERHG